MAAAVDCREGRPKKRRNRRYCCVYKCHTEEGYDPNIIFYSFPSKPYEKERRQRWIQAVRRERYLVKLSQWTSWKKSVIGTRKCQLILHCLAHPLPIRTWDVKRIQCQQH
ncbi:hypothetical protein HPB50_023979 [Hyalomma asiaticum]|uniref:Uncharacterized protein n=1 Tax=Hyalomma asiaticum TaxID=266040 RepID=A0ACB7S3W6_HYAAI|nr:hypothetical protein HPB50_023979 [Hyalomma asiaticum]